MNEDDEAIDITQEHRDHHIDNNEMPENEEVPDDDDVQVEDIFEEDNGSSGTFEE